jgi:hypothetical protein
MLPHSSQSTRCPSTRPGTCTPNTVRGAVSLSVDALLMDCQEPTRCFTYAVMGAPVPRFKYLPCAGTQAVAHHLPAVGQVARAMHVPATSSPCTAVALARGGLSPPRCTATSANATRGTYTVPPCATQPLVLTDAVPPRDSSP